MCPTEAPVSYPTIPAPAAIDREQRQWAGLTPVEGAKPRNSPLTARSEGRHRRGTPLAVRSEETNPSRYLPCVWHDGIPSAPYWRRKIEETNPVRHQESRPRLTPISNASRV